MRDPQVGEEDTSESEQPEVRGQAQTKGLGEQMVTKVAESVFDIEEDR